MEGKRGSECLLKPVSNIDFNPADGNDLYETLCGAFQLALNEVAKYEHNNFGCKESYNSLELTQRKVKTLNYLKEIKNGFSDSNTKEE